MKRGPEEVEGLGIQSARIGVVLAGIGAAYVSGLGFQEKWSGSHVLWVGVGKRVEDMRSRQMVLKSQCIKCNIESITQ